MQILFQMYHRANNELFIGSPPGTHSSEEQRCCLENQLENYEWQLKILHAVLTASGDQEREQLLKDHPGDICTLVHSITEKVLFSSALIVKLANLLITLMVFIGLYHFKL